MRVYLTIRRRSDPSLAHGPLRLQDREEDFLTGYSTLLHLLHPAHLQEGASPSPNQRNQKSYQWSRSCWPTRLPTSRRS
ncbi:unnamed protein product [Acanthoscelides obtectus]|uniref:Uncharacterized protein n=1 Tax=Acanthoscelides obtectus TaxID=200917 RepID=A0A9P0QDC8_ACAOB|nr:unnamed protein product [Acanthoscelides obtectus]CAK1689208.1 hypothetical protein AOBTE_LOCUS37082 [Acanthoscelides obtectus]